MFVFHVSVYHAIYKVVMQFFALWSNDKVLLSHTVFCLVKAETLMFAVLLFYNYVEFIVFKKKSNQRTLLS